MVEQKDIRRNNILVSPNTYEYTNILYVINNVDKSC